MVGVMEEHNRKVGGGGGGKLFNFIAFKTISMRIMLAFSQSTFCS